MDVWLVWLDKVEKGCDDEFLAVCRSKERAEQWMADEAGDDESYLADMYCNPEELI